MKCLFTYLAWTPFLCEEPAGLKRLKRRQRPVLASQSHHRLSSACTDVGGRLGLRAFTTDFGSTLCKIKYKHKGPELPQIQKMLFFISDLSAALGFAISSLLLGTSEMGKQSGVAISILCIWQLFYLPKKSPLFLGPHFLSAWKSPQHK